MIIGIATNLSVASKMSERNINPYTTSFPFHPNDLNLRENMGISTTINRENMMMIAYNISFLKTRFVNPNGLFMTTSK